MSARLMKKLTSPLIAAAVLALSSISASAITIDPTYQTFGTLSAADFGGTGIPNTSVAVTKVAGGTTVLGLSASARYNNPTVTNDGAGTFFATAGNDAAHGEPDYAQWNFNFYVGGPLLPVYPVVKLYYDSNPAVGNNVSDYFLIPLSAQNSWNLGMNFINGAFNPSVAGEYDFAIVAEDTFSGKELGRVAITVKVAGASVPDTATTMSLIGLSMVGLVALRRRFAK